MKTTHKSTAMKVVVTIVAIACTDKEMDVGAVSLCPLLRKYQRTAAELSGNSTHDSSGTNLRNECDSYPPPSEESSSIVALPPSIDMVLWCESDGKAGVGSLVLLLVPEISLGEPLFSWLNTEIVGEGTEGT